MKQLIPMTEKQNKKIEETFEQIYKLLSDIGYIVGPSFGAKFSDKLIKTHNNMVILKVQISDRYYAQEIARKRPERG